MSEAITLYPSLLGLGEETAISLKRAAHNENPDLGQRIDKLTAMMTEMLQMMKDKEKNSFSAKMDRFFGKVATKLTAAGTHLSTTATKIKGHLTTFARAVKNTAESIGRKFKASAFGKKIMAGAKATKEQMVAFGKVVGAELKKLGAAMKKFFDNTLAPWFKTQGKAVKAAFEKAWKKAEPVLKKGAAKVVVGLKKAHEVAKDGRDMAQVKLGRAAQAAGQALLKSGVKTETKARDRKADREFTKLAKSISKSSRGR